MILSPTTTRRAAFWWVVGSALWVQGDAAPLSAQEPVAHTSFQPNSLARVVTFETAQGTAMNVDVAPDGRTIVFDLLGDIYTVPITGGTATRLTSGAAFDTEPVFSPDGKRVAFVSDRSGNDNIWLMDADGRNPRAFTYETTAAVRAPEWVTNSDHVLVAQKPDGYWIYRADGSGTALRQLLPEAARPRSGEVVWSRDGHFMYVAEGGLIRRIDIARRESDVVRYGSAGFRPALSPDGQWLIVGSQLDNETGLRLINVVTEAERWLVYPLPDRDNSMLRFSQLGGPSAVTPPPPLPRYDFMPNGRAIIIATGGTFQRIELRTGRMQPISFRATVEQELAPRAAPALTLERDPDSIRSIRDVQRDRAGTRTVFTALGKIWIRDGSGPAKPLVDSPQAPGPLLEYEPALSPDGLWVAYVTWHDVEGGQLWRVPVTGGRPQQLIKRRGVYRHPVWSPDGSIIAVVREEETPNRSRATRIAGEVYVLPAVGGTPRRIAATEADDVPAFSADGQAVLVVARPASGLLRIELRTGDVDTVAALPEAGGTRTEVISPTLARPRPDPSGSVALKGATVITMRGDEVLRDATVLVTGSRIAAVGLRGSVSLPPGVRRIDVTGKTIIPGLIDVRGAIPLARDLLEGTNIPLAANLAFGVTTVRALPAGDSVVEEALRAAARYAERLETGSMTGARFLATGAVTAANAGELTSLEAARALVRRQQDLGATAIVQTVPLTRRQRQWLAAAAREGGLALVGESADLRLALTMMADGYHTIQGTIPDAQLYDDVRRFAAASQTVYAPTLLAATGGVDGGGTAEEYFLETIDVRQDPKLQRLGLVGSGWARWRVLEDYHFLAVGQQAARLEALGTPVAVGTAGRRPGVGVHWEMWALEMSGFTAHDALRAATAVAAEALGLGSELGTIEVGKVADLVVLDTDPLTDLKHSRATRYVMRNGELFDAATLAMIWPRATPPLPLRDTRYDPPPVAAEGVAREVRATTEPTVFTSMDREISPSREASGLGAADRLPIQPTRTISFETTEGTFMNIDLSPDGRTIVFNLLGDIYSVPAVGGVATQLTRGLSYDLYPVWSPDGAQIAYISDASGADNLWVMRADGTNRRPVTREGEQAHLSSESERANVFSEIEWMPDGSGLVSRDTIYDLAGGTRPLGVTSQGSVRFSADGRYIHFVRDGVRRFDRQAGESIPLARPPVSFGQPVISPDGKWLAYVTGGESVPYNGLRVRNLATGEDCWLAYAISKRRNSVERYVFTHDSKAVLIAYGGKLHRIDVSTGDDVVIPLTASVSVELGPFAYYRHRVTNDSLSVRYIRSPTINPDGKTLVFEALQHLYVKALPHGTPQLLVKQPYGQFQPAYSRDGKWIAYVTWSDVEGGHVWRVRASGGEPERLTSVAAYYQHPAWSPDGTTLAVLKTVSWIARERGLPATGSLQLLPSRGGTPRTIVRDVARDHPVTFTSDGQHVLFQADSELVSTGLDGRDRKVVLRIGNDPQPRIAGSPDGRYAAYVAGSALYLTPLDTLTISVTAGDAPRTGPAVRLTQRDVMDLRWNHASNALTWVSANEVYRVDPSDVMAATGSVIGQLKVLPVQLAVPRYTARGILALRGARVITMNGDQVLENATVVITNDRITAVGPLSSVVIPRGAKVLDMRGKTVMPGLVDLHAHFFHPSFEPVVTQSHWGFLANLAYGVTTARDVSSSNEQFGYVELIETGQMVGPRLFSVGLPVDRPIENLEHARAIVQHRKAMGAVAVKQYLQPTRRQRQWLLIAGAEAGLNVTNHEGSSRRMLAAVFDGFPGIEHTLPDADLFEDITRLIAQSRIWYTPTLQVIEWGGSYFHDRARLHDDPKYRRFVLHRWIDVSTRSGVVKRDLPWLDYAREAAAIARYGGHVTVGSHGDTQGIGAHWEIWALQMGGITNHEALRAATILGAEGLGIQEDLGSIEVGKLADLLVLDANPLESIENTLAIRYVMKNGVLYEGDTLNTVWPIKRALPEWMYPNYRDRGATPMR